MRVVPFVRAAAAVAVALSIAAAPAFAQLKNLNALGFTYQGELRNAGAAVNSACDFEASLWDDPDAGAQVGAVQLVPLVPVSSGRFTMTLNENGEFGVFAFEGAQRWLQLAVRCGAEVDFTALLPRQPLSPTPFAFALPGVVPGAFNVPAGQGNRAASFAVAFGRRAKAVNTGSMVFADSTNADFVSTADNQASMRMANGFLIANDAGGAKVVPVGTRYRDNAIVAWARVTASGGLDSNFNVASVTKLATGVYRFTLNSSLSSGFSLVPIVTPEIDPLAGDPPLPPVGAANVRIPATNQVAAGNTFDVYIYNGNFALVDNDFHLMVTGR